MNLNGGYSILDAGGAFTDNPMVSLPDIPTPKKPPKSKGGIRVVAPLQPVPDDFPTVRVSTPDPAAPAQQMNPVATTPQGSPFSMPVVVTPDMVQPVGVPQATAQKPNPYLIGAVVLGIAAFGLMMRKR